MLGQHKVECSSHQLQLCVAESNGYPGSTRPITFTLMTEKPTLCNRNPIHVFADTMLEVRNLYRDLNANDEVIIASQTSKRRAGFRGFKGWKNTALTLCSRWGYNSREVQVQSSVELSENPEVA